MAYSTTGSDGQSISVADETIDSSKIALKLIGRNATNYGQSIVENTVKHLENFAGVSAPAPTYTLKGQLWYNTTDSSMRVYDGTTWKRLSSFTVSSSQPTTNLVAGTGYVNSFDDHLKIYDGSNWRNAVLPGGTVTSAYSSDSGSGAPSNYGSKVETLYLTEATTNRVYPVLALKYVSDSTYYAGITPDSAHNNANATIMAIFSDLAFTVSNADPYYGELVDSNSMNATIVRGMNLRSDYSETVVSRSLTSDYANVSGGITVSTAAPYTPIPAADIIHIGRGYIPSVASSYTLGNVNNRFSHTYTDTLTIGNPSTIQTVSVIGNVTIGNSSNSVHHIYSENLTVSGNVNFASGVQNLGSSGSPVENLYATNIAVTTGTVSTTPSANTDIANKLYVDNRVLSATANTLTLVATNTTNSTHYPLFAEAATGNEEPRTDTGFTYNPSTGVLSATVFSGVATTARYADLAENYLADEAYVPGTVVKIGGDAEITQTTRHADIDVFGVISTNPAYLMNADAPGLPVALQGRVPVRVIGRVRKGERLTTSDVPGVAWGVAEDDVPLQAIIGRALQDKDDGGESIIEAVVGVK